MHFYVEPKGMVFWASRCQKTLRRRAQVNRRWRRLASTSGAIFHVQSIVTRKGESLVSLTKNPLKLLSNQEMELCINLRAASMEEATSVYCCCCKDTGLFAYTQHLCFVSDAVRVCYVFACCCFFKANSLHCYVKMNICKCRL